MFFQGSITERLPQRFLVYKWAQFQCKHLEALFIGLVLVNIPQTFDPDLFTLKYHQRDSPFDIKLHILARDNITSLSDIHTLS